MREGALEILVRKDIGWYLVREEKKGPHRNRRLFDEAKVSRARFVRNLSTLSIPHFR